MTKLMSLHSWPNTKKTHAVVHLKTINMYFSGPPILFARVSVLSKNAFQKCLSYSTFTKTYSFFQSVFIYSSHPSSYLHAQLLLPQSQNWCCHPSSLSICNHFKPRKFLSNCLNFLLMEMYTYVNSLMCWCIFPILHLEIQPSFPGVQCS